MIEVWLPAPGHESFAEVSNLGRVKSLARYCEAGRRGRQLKPERIINGSFDRYRFVRLPDASGQLKHRYIHRLVAAAFIPNLEGKPHVNHIDGDKQNNSVENLEWATPTENQRHAIATGLLTFAKGEDWFATKLTRQEVQEIRSAYRPRENSNELAQKYGVVPKTIVAIANRRKRADVDCASWCVCKACTPEAAA